ncbi:MAG: acyl-CoA dehydratase activase-related protein [Pilosibacter sp.]
MKQLLIGIDVGSTTTKITVLNKTTESLLYSDYRRHHADQLASVLFAIRYADMAEDSFHQELLAEGERILKQVTEENRYAVIPASRPYQNDPLVNHNLPEMFTSLGIPVLTADAVPGVNDVDLTNSRLDVVNNYHARMLGSAVIAAENPHLEYVQIVSFGCGHDAYLSDEIIRLMKQGSGKIPLVLKLDESEIQGPLRIRVRSFIETVLMQREKHEEAPVHALTDPYPVKYEKKDRKERIVLIPNTSHAFCRVMSAAMERQGLRAEPLPIGRDEAIRLGKKYVHNDICFPAQIVIGEALAALKSGKYDGKDVAIATGKYIGDCRLTHYSALLRKALDDAGFSDVPILTNDDADFHNLHPGFRLNLLSALRIAYALPMIDILEELLRKIRPYELTKGNADAAFEQAMDAVIDGLSRHGVNGAKHGFEIIEARMSDVIQKSYFYRDMQVREYHLHKPLQEKLWYRMADLFFDLAHDAADKIASAHPLYDRPAVRLPELVKESDPIIHHTFDAGEGVLIPGEILHHAAHGCRAFVILQPFGCLPNHVVGRGISKRLKELYPDIQILPLDYDPDVSFANIENRLQMLIMNAREQEAEKDKTK